MSGAESHGLAKSLQAQNHQETEDHNAGHDTELLDGAHLPCPSDHEVAHDETTCRATEVDPCGHLATGFGVAVQHVRIDADSRDHDAEDVETPSERGDHVMVCPLEREPQQDQARDHEGRGDPHDRQSGFRLEVSTFAAGGSASDEVVKPVAD